MNKEIIAESIEIAGKTALSLIPVGGTLITCVWDSVKAYAAQKRLNDWKDLVENRLSRLEYTLDDLGNNELFATAIMRTTDIALKTAERKKREYLANSIYHSTNIPIDEGMLMIYLDYLDRYSVWHLQILHFFQNPKANGNFQNSNLIMGSAIEALRPVFPELCQNVDLVVKIVNDLQMDGLMSRGNYMNATMTSNGVFASRTTELGNNFLKFILLDE